jgi:putative polyhydroxyalkanoate system protein
MSEIVVHHRHGRSVASARRLAESIARRLREQCGGTYDWDGNTLRFQRLGASGQVTVSARDVEVRVTIGLLLRPLRARIEREIQGFFEDNSFSLPKPADGER